MLVIRHGIRYNRSTGSTDHWQPMEIAIRNDDDLKAEVAYQKTPILRPHLKAAGAIRLLEMRETTPDENLSRIVW